MPYQPILPTWLALNAANDTSPTGLTDPRTGLQYFAGGLNLGDYFDLTDQEAANLSYKTLPSVTLRAGRYRRILVDSGATASNVKTGAIGYAVAGNQFLFNRVTSYDKGIVGLRAVVFLNSITPGNYGFVQELGVASVLCGATLQKATPTTGDILNSTTLGVADDPTSQIWTPNLIGVSMQPPSPNTLCLTQLYWPVLQG